MQINDAKKELAHRLTAMCHGIESADKALETARKVFEEGAVGDDLPVLEVSKEEINVGISIIELFARARLSESKSEARKLIRGQGARLNDEKALDENLLITQAHFTNYGYIKLSAGKKKHVLVQVAD
jgi:tyrosyl-tRNA synthetase